MKCGRKGQVARVIHSRLVIRGAGSLGYRGYRPSRFKETGVRLLRKWRNNAGGGARDCKGHSSRRKIILARVSMDTFGER